MTISNVFFDSLVGYTLAKFRFRGRKFIFLAILSTLMIPTEMLVIPWYLMSATFGWLDTYWGIMFPGMMTGFGTFLMRQFFEGVPDDFMEAARVDGYERIRHLVAHCHAAGGPCPVGSGNLHLPWQLDRLLLAPDRDHLQRALHAALSASPALPWKRPFNGR